MDTADVVVVGLGAVGSATLHRLALKGVRVVGIDRFNPPHAHGSTHGDSRITRLAVAEGDAYVPLVRRSHEVAAQRPCGLRSVRLCARRPDVMMVAGIQGWDDRAS